MKTHKDYQEEFKKLNIYKNIFFSNPRAAVSILTDLKRISNFDYKTSNYTNGEIMSFPVYLDENRIELEKLFNINNYLIRLHENFHVNKEYNNQSVVDLIQLVVDFRYFHPIDIRMDVDSENYVLYDPDWDENFDYYYKLELSSLKR